MGERLVYQNHTIVEYRKFSEFSQEEIESYCEQLLADREDLQRWIQSHGPHSIQGKWYRNVISQNEEAFRYLISMHLPNNFRECTYSEVEDSLMRRVSNGFRQFPQQIDVALAIYNQSKEYRDWDITFESRLHYAYRDVVEKVLG